MTQDATKVRVDKPVSAGAAYLAPAATALPVDNTTALAAGFLCVGYLDPGGIIETPTRQSTAIWAYGGDQVASAANQDGLTVEFTMLETNTASLGVFWGVANVTTLTGTATVKATSADFLHGVLVLDTVSNGNKSRRIYPDAQITARGPIVTVDNAARMYKVTFSVYPDSTGVKRYEYVSGVGA